MGADARGAGLQPCCDGLYTVSRPEGLPHSGLKACPTAPYSNFVSRTSSTRTPFGARAHWTRIGLW